MENNKSFKLMAIVALCVSIIGVSVAFAALSENLTVTGTGYVDPVIWDIHFEIPDENVVPAMTGNASNEIFEVTNDGTGLDYDFTLTAPGDSVTFTFDIVNNGELDAKITNITGLDVASWTLTPYKQEYDEQGFPGEMVVDPDTEGRAADLDYVLENLDFSFTYLENGQAVGMNDVLLMGETKTVVLTLGLDENLKTIPTGPVAVNASDLIITYTQYQAPVVDGE